MIMSREVTYGLGLAALHTTRCAFANIDVNRQGLCIDSALGARVWRHAW